MAPVVASWEMRVSSSASQPVHPHEDPKSLAPPFITTQFHLPATSWSGMLKLPRKPGPPPLTRAPKVARLTTSRPSSASITLPTSPPEDRFHARTESPITRMSPSCCRDVGPHAAKITRVNVRYNFRMFPPSFRKVERERSHNDKSRSRQEARTFGDGSSPICLAAFLEQRLLNSKGQTGQTERISGTPTMTTRTDSGAPRRA